MLNTEATLSFYCCLESEQEAHEQSPSTSKRPYSDARRVQHNAHLRSQGIRRQVRAEFGPDGAIAAVRARDLAPLHTEARTVLRHLALHGTKKNRAASAHGKGEHKVGYQVGHRVLGSGWRESPASARIERGRPVTSSERGQTFAKAA